MAYHPNNCCAPNTIFSEDNFAPYPFCLPDRGNEDACFVDFDLNLTFDDLTGCNDIHQLQLIDVLPIDGDCMDRMDIDDLKNSSQQQQQQQPPQQEPTLAVEYDHMNSLRLLQSITTCYNPCRASNRRDNQPTGNEAKYARTKRSHVISPLPHQEQPSHSIENTLVYQVAIRKFAESRKRSAFSSRQLSMQLANLPQRQVQQLLETTLAMGQKRVAGGGCTSTSPTMAVITPRSSFSDILDPSMIDSSLI